MSYLVFDIETAGLSFDDFDEGRQEYLLRGTKDDDERAERKRMMSLNPLTARVVAIGMLSIASLDAEPKGCVYSNTGAAEGSEETEGVLDDGSIWRTMPEQEMLRKWWDVLAKVQTKGAFTLITFNGRGFDCPFLMLRSAALRVKPSRNLMDGTRWKYDRHTDLQEELAFRNFGGNGATRRFNFDFYCKAFGIKSPKGEGITGYDVPEFWEAGMHREIAEYCMRDVHATWELFKFWREYLGSVEEA